MKTLIVYYSLDGNCHYVSQTIATKIKADLLRLKLKKEIDNASPMKFFWGGKQVFMKEKPELENFSLDLNNYDLIIIGTPVWAWNYAPAISSFLHKIELKNKKIALFCCHGGQPGKTLDNLQTRLAGNTIISKVDFQEPLKSNQTENVDKISSWIKNFV
jgi:flavodoxin